jgi:hypothetical protein
VRQPVRVTVQPGESARTANKNLDEVPLFAMLMLQLMPHKRLQRLCHIKGYVQEELVTQTCRRCRL